MLSLILKENYFILEAQNGVEALNILKKDHNNIALIMLDIVMPVMDGVEMMTMARREGLLNRVPVIAITSEESSVKMKRIRDLGICEIIHKPFDPTVVMNRVNNMSELFVTQRI